MSNGNNDDDHVAVEVFSQYKIDQTSLCQSYRNHLETKILNMERGIRWSVYLTGAIITIILGVINWYLNVVIG